MMEAEQLGAAEGGKRVRAIRELRWEERKLRSQTNELDSMMEAEQLGAAEGSLSLDLSLS